MKGKAMQKVYDRFKDADIELFCYDSIDSTNKQARRYAEERGGKICPTLFMAESQTEGRGRLGRSFFSPEKTGLYMTLLLEAPKNRQSFERLTALAAVAAAESIAEVFGASPKIKWVNDLYLNEKKVAGILAESFPVGESRFVALGVGINLCTSDFPEALADKAGSVAAGLSSEELSAKKRELAFLISVKLIAALEGQLQREYMQSYRERSCVIGRDISFFAEGEEKRGRVTDITDDGALEVRLSQGNTVILSTGEISIFSRDGKWY